MALNRVRDGKTITWKNASEVLVRSGWPVEVGSLVGVALVDIPPGQSGELAVSGVYRLPLAEGEWVEQGAELYLDAETGTLGPDGAWGALAGYAWEDADASDGVVLVQVRLPL